MKILLLHISEGAKCLPVAPLGMACVAAAAARAGHQVHRLVLPPEEMKARLPGLLSRLAFDAIGISVRNIDDQRRVDPVFFPQQVRRVVDLCRRCSSAPLIVGGAGFSIFPQRILDYLGADYGIRGEGEISFVDLLDRLQNHQPVEDIGGLVLPGRSTAAPGRFPDLATVPLPLPGRDLPLPAPSADLWVPFQTRRGCAMDCSYCSTASIEGRPLRRRPIGQAVANLKEYLAAGYRQFFLVDNTFNLPESYAVELCETMQAAGCSCVWKAIVYPWRMSERLVRAMAGAGCEEVSLGFESGSPGVLRRMNKRYNPEDVIGVSRLFSRYGIKRLGFLLLGGPGETRDTVLESLQFADDLECEALKITVGLRIYPGTPLEGVALREGVITAATDLLRPTFYLAPGLEAWLPATVAAWAAERPHWLY